MNIIDGQFNSMPSDYDTLGAGEHTGNYAGYYVIEDVTFSSFIPKDRDEKVSELTIIAGSTIPVNFTGCIITAGKILAYIG